MFYFDEKLKRYESEHSWNESILYLEHLFLKQPTCEKLNSLVGFSWYYLIEWPIDVDRRDKEGNIVVLDMWKKYLRVGIEQYSCSLSFRFIAGYSLLMNGYYIDEYKYNYEQIALDMFNQINNSTDNLKQVVKVILDYQKQKKYKPLQIKHEVLEEIFKGESLLENYFKEIYG